MIDGHIDGLNRLGVVGWAADADHPDAAVEVAVVINGREQARIRADRPRTDLRDLGKFGEGRHGFELTFTPPLSADRDHEVVVRAGAEGKVLRHACALVQMDEVEDGRVVTPPVVFAPEPHERSRGDIRALGRYVIHVGPHKTGTKYLQRGFFDLKGMLYERGVLYPTQWAEPDSKNHWLLVERLRAGDPTLEAEFAELSASPSQTIVISSEDIVDLPQEAMSYLKRLLGSETVSLVFYCRRWSELIPSGWQETVKQGGTTTLPEFLAQHMINPVGSTLLNYDQPLNRLSKAFGHDSLRLVSYSNLASTDTDILVHFMSTFLNWPAVPITPRARENISLDIHDVEAIRALNDLASSHHGGAHFDVTRRYLELKPELALSRIFGAMEQDRRQIEVSEASIGLRLMHEVIFERYGARLVQPSSGFNLFDLRSANVPYIGPKYLLTEGVREDLLEVYRRMEAAAR